eukprot:gene6953-11115_t
MKQTSFKNSSVIRLNKETKDDFPYNMTSQSIFTLLLKFTDPKDGVVIKDRSYRLKKYSKCFIGKEAVEWLKTKNNECSGFSRTELTNLLELLRKIGVFRHVVHNSKKFEDEFLFFRFTHLTKTQEKIKNILVQNYEDLLKIRRNILDQDSISTFYEDFTDKEKGIDIQDRVYHWKTYKNCFLSCIATNWIANYHSISKQASVSFGECCRKIGMFEHVSDQNKQFQDNFSFFHMNNYTTFKQNLMTKYLDFIEKTHDFGSFSYDIGLSEEQKIKIKNTKQFEIDPDEVMKRENEKGDVPMAFNQMINYLIMKDSHKIPGIFRISGSNEDIIDFRQRYDFGEKVDLNEADDIHVVASLFKLYLKSMPEPIIPFDLYSKFLELQEMEENQLIENFIILLKSISLTRKKMIIKLIMLMDKIQQNSTQNKMTKENLSIVVGVNVLRSSDPNPLILLQNTGKITFIFSSLIENYSNWKNEIEN